MDFNESKKLNGAFDILGIKDKIQSLEAMLAEENIDFKNQAVIVAVPSIDDNRRLIYREDPALYEAQVAAAHTLAEHIMLNMNADVVTVATDHYKMHAVAGSIEPPHASVIFLHEFTTGEQLATERILSLYKQGLKTFKLY